MIKFIKYLLGCILAGAGFIAIIFLAIVCTPQDTFRSSYQSLIQDKFRILKETDEPKIIMVAGSSSAFGLDQEMLEQATGYKVANLGLHAGLGAVFYTGLSKANINEGDIVLLGYEDGWNRPGYFDYIDVKLVMSAIDNHIEMYRYLPIRIWPQIIGSLFDYAYTKQAFQPATGNYSRDAFDPETAQMTFPRNEIMYGYRDGGEMYGGTINIEDPQIAPDVKKYITEYKKFVESKGASIYFVSAPKIGEGIVGDLSNLETLKENEEKEIGIEYISDPCAYAFPEDLMSNALFHCNTRGEKYRTKLLIHELYDAGVVDVANIDDYAFSKDDQVIFEEDIVEFLKDINDPDYVVFLSAMDDAAGAMTDEIQSKLSELGVKTDLRGKTQNSFYAVLHNGESLDEAIGADSPVEGSGEIGDVAYSISSAGADCGNTSSIVVNETEYSRVQSGLNIVIWNIKDNCLVDAVNFDTSADLACRR